MIDLVPQCCHPVKDPRFFHFSGELTSVLNSPLVYLRWRHPCQGPHPAQHPELEDELFLPVPFSQEGDTFPPKTPEETFPLILVARIKSCGHSQAHTGLEVELLWSMEITVSPWTNHNQVTNLLLLAVQAISCFHLLETIWYMSFLLSHSFQVFLKVE